MTMPIPDRPPPDGAAGADGPPLRILDDGRAKRLSRDDPGMVILTNY